MAHEMIEEGKLASEKQKNIQAAAEFWADMRKTHGFLNQAAGLNVQEAAITDETVRESGSSSKQQVEASFESRENPKRRKRTDDDGQWGRRRGATDSERDTYPQPQTGSTDKVWQSHRNPQSYKAPNIPMPGTSSKRQVETSTENLGNRKRKEGSDDKLPHPSTLLLDTTNPRPVKRSRGFTGESVKPSTTSSRNAVPPMTHETEKSALTDMSPSPAARVTHGFHPRAAGTYDGGSQTDASPNQPDTKKCIQVGRETYAVTSQPGTSSDSIPVIDPSNPSAPKQKHMKKRKPNRHPNRHHSRDDRSWQTRK